MIIDAAGDAFEALVELGALALCESLDGERWSRYFFVCLWCQ